MHSSASIFLSPATPKLRLGLLALLLRR